MPSRLSMSWCVLLRPFRFQNCLNETQAQRITALGRVAVAGCAALLLVVAVPSHAQGYLQRFRSRGDDVKKVQPSWPTPLVGTTPLLGQFDREQFVRQKVQGGDAVWNIGNGKGPGLLLSKRVEVDLAVPNYVVHGNAPGVDGIGDFCVLTKYRIVSRGKEDGNYSLAVVGSQSWATGVGKNGAPSSTRGLTLTGGKAFGRYVVVSSAGATFPTAAGRESMGRPVAWNTALEAHVAPRVWAQIESNTTFYNGGAHDGKRQHFVTPGIWAVPLRPWSAASRSYLLLGVGMQFATTRYHGSDHNLILDSKLYF